mmetsp:Transcript_41906/g.132297  ORF Transcript_41906/g.132297 Transcript_41906/m.132297 type:complete len:278 (-) Transcript_41906:143-976(-)
MQRGSASARAAVLVNHRTSKGTGRLAVAAKGREAPARRLVAAGVAAAVARRALDVAALGAADVDRLLLAALLDDVELDLLLLHQRAEARRGDCRLVHKEVVLPAARRDEAKPLLAVEPLDLSDLFALRRLNALGPSARLQVAAAATAAAATVVALDVHAARARDIGGLHLAVLLHRVILDLFALAERAEAVCVDRRLVDEKILTAAVGRDEAEALLRVEPFDSAALLHADRRPAPRRRRCREGGLPDCTTQQQRQHAVPITQVCAAAAVATTAQLPG